MGLSISLTINGAARQILLEDRIPESAACNTSVALCKELEMEGLAGVCNGILRNLVRQKDELTPCCVRTNWRRTAWA